MKRGFTLAELLIALAILGVIATFTIPKVLQSQQSGKFKATAKETASMIAGAYDAYKLNNTPTSSTKPSALFQYMNYVRYDTTSQIDHAQGLTTDQCANTKPCIMLHNGAMLLALDTETFGGTGTTNLIWYLVDPVGSSYSGGANTSEKSVSFALYYNGRIATWGTISPGSYSSIGAQTADPAKDPGWFGWD